MSVLSLSIKNTMCGHSVTQCRERPGNDSDLVNGTYYAMNNYDSFSSELFSTYLTESGSW